MDVVDNLFQRWPALTPSTRATGIERFFRDLHVGGQQISGLPNNYEYAGQVMLGANVTPSLYT